MGTIAARKPNIWRQIWRYRSAYLFIAPFYVSFAAFSLYPMLYTILLSFHEWDGGRAPWYPVGLQNYIDLLFRDRVFRISLLNSLIYWLMLVPLLVGASLGLAVIFNASWLRGRALFRTILFLPYITSTLIISLVFLSLLDDAYGWLNAGLRALGLPAIPWLRSTEYSKLSVVLLIFWRNVGYYMVIMLAGLQSIERELYEAAAIDGASSWQAFRWITVPLMRPVILFVMIVTTIMVLNMFEAVYALTRGGPEYSSQPLMLTLYQRAFLSSRLGAGSALAMIIGGITILIALIQLKVLRGDE